MLQISWIFWWHLTTLLNVKSRCSKSQSILRVAAGLTLMFVCCGIKKANYNVAIQTVQTVCMTVQFFLEFAQILGMCIPKQEKFFFFFFFFFFFACFRLLCVTFFVFFLPHFPPQSCQTSSFECKSKSIFERSELNGKP